MGVFVGSTSLRNLRQRKSPVALTVPHGYDTFHEQLEPYPEWWRDRPFEATATAFQIRNAGANSRSRPSGVKIR